MKYKIGDEVIVTKTHLSRFTVGKVYKVIGSYSYDLPHSVPIIESNDPSSPGVLYRSNDDKFHYMPYKQWLFETEMKDIINEI